MNEESPLHTSEGKSPLHRFASTLGDRCLDSDPMQVAEILWLASRLVERNVEGEVEVEDEPGHPDGPPLDPTHAPPAIPPGQTLGEGQSSGGSSAAMDEGEKKEGTGEAPPTGTTPPPGNAPGDGTGESSAALDTTSGGTGLYARGKGEPGMKALSASSVRAPAAAGLPDALAIGRALRPLTRKFKSGELLELEEEATADFIALTAGKLYAPVYRAAPERWFEVALVVEKSPSMDFWQPAITEFFRLLSHHGAFRDVRLWSLQDKGVPQDEGVQQDEANDQDGPQGKKGSKGKDKKKDAPKKDHRIGLYSAKGTQHEPGEMVIPGQRRLILFISDCVSEAWRSGRLSAVLADWAATMPLAIVHTLPRTLWSRTWLGSPVARLSALRPGPPNGELLVQLPHERYGTRSHSGIHAPAFTLDAASVSQWARTLMATGGASIDGAFLSDRPRGEASLPEEAAQLDAKQRVQRLRTMVTPDAFRLAIYLSLSYLTIPVMRLIQRVMMPHTTSAVLAEVILGGVLTRTTPADDSISIDEIVYEFHGGVRDILQEWIRRSEARQVLHSIGEYVSDRTGQAINFSALVEDPEGLERLPADALPFAQCIRKYWSRLGLSPGPIITAPATAVAVSKSGTTENGSPLKKDADAETKARLASIEERHREIVARQCRPTYEWESLSDQPPVFPDVVITSTTSENSILSMDEAFAFSSYSPLVLVGVPGSGNSEYLRHLAYSMATRDGSREGPNATIPFYLKGDHFERGEDRMWQSIEEAILGESPHWSGESLERLLRSGRALILLDVLDGVRRRLPIVLERALQRYPAMRLVIATRPASSPINSFSSGAAFVVLRPLSIEQVQRLASPMLPGSSSAHFANSALTHVAFATLCSTPFYCYFAARLFYGSSELPTTRTELLRRAVERGSKVEGTHWQIRKNFYGRLAAGMLDARKNSLSRVEAEKIGLSFGGEFHESRLDSFGPWDDGILDLSRLPGQLQFSHRLFQDFFAARAFARDPSRSWGVLRMRIDDPNWWGVTVFACGLRGGTESAEIVGELLARARKAEHQADRMGLYLHASECLQEMRDGYSCQKLLDDLKKSSQAEIENLTADGKGLLTSNPWASLPLLVNDPGRSEAFLMNGIQILGQIGSWPAWTVLAGYVNETATPAIWHAVLSIRLGLLDSSRKDFDLQVFREHALRVSLAKLEIDNQSLSLLEGLPNLEAVDLSHTGVSDILPLAAFKHLVSIDLSHTHVVDLSPLVHLAALSSLSLFGLDVAVPRALGRSSVKIGRSEVAQEERRESKVPAKKVPAKKVPAKKVPAKKVPAKKVPAKKVPAKKVPAKKVPAKKVPTKKVPAKKVPAKKVPAKKVPAKKVPAKKVPAKKVPAKKVPAKKVPAKKAPVKKARALGSSIDWTPPKKPVKPTQVSWKLAGKTESRRISLGVPALRKTVVAHIPFYETSLGQIVSRRSKLDLYTLHHAVVNRIVLDADESGKVVLNEVVIENTPRGKIVLDKATLGKIELSSTMLRELGLRQTEVKGALSKESPIDWTPPKKTVRKTPVSWTPRKSVPAKKVVVKKTVKTGSADLGNTAEASMGPPSKGRAASRGPTTKAAAKNDARSRLRMIRGAGAHDDYDEPFAL